MTAKKATVSNVKAGLRDRYHWQPHIIPSESQLQHLYIPIAQQLSKLHSAKKQPLVIGLNGAQGAGKTIMATILSHILFHQFNKRVVILSLDDLYLTQAERIHLAETIHPLFAVRGVPGTHDVNLGLTLLKILKNATTQTEIMLPRFDKSIDERLPTSDWYAVSGPVDIILFEGWCVGAKPQNEEQLDGPINSLEENNDSDAIWRKEVNECLAAPYQQLFAELDLLLMLKVDSFADVLQHRWEEELTISRFAQTEPQTKEELEKFIQHFQRITEHMLTYMPQQADIVVTVSPQRNYQILKI